MQAARQKKRPFNPFTCSAAKPRFDIQLLDRSFETADEAEAELGRRVLSLERHGAVAGRHLRSLLSGCSFDEPCLLACCPGCYRQFRIWATSQALSLFRREPALIAITLVPARAAFNAGDLAQFDPRTFANTLRTQLRRVGATDALIYGGIDGDFDAACACYQPHFHLVAPATLRPVFERLAARFYAGDRGAVPGWEIPRVYRPTLIQDIRHRPRVMSYALKSFWPQASRWTNADGASRRSSPRRLKEPLHAQWLIWRGQFRLTDFVFLAGARRQADKLHRMVP